MGFFDSLISDILEEGLSGSGVKGGYGSDIAHAKSIIDAAMRIRYAQGWQWTVDVDGYSGFDMFVKDITYASDNIETESKVIGAVEFNKPTHMTAGPVTMTVRDDENGTLAKWFYARRARVVNKDGTINLPVSYLMKIRLYRVTASGGKILDEEMRVFPTQLGEVSRSRDQVTEFFSFPLTFQRYTSAGSAIGAAVSGVIGAGTGAIKGAVIDF